MELFIMVIKYSDFEIIVSKSTHQEFDMMQDFARNEGWVKAIADDKDTYYCVIMKDSIPCFSFTAIEMSPTVVRGPTKLYGNPEIKHKLSNRMIYNMFKESVLIFSRPEHSQYKLQFISRHPSMTSWKKIHESVGCTVDDDNMYLVGNRPDKQSAWKQIYYKGDIAELNTQCMSVKKYESMFGPYFFNYDWSQPAIDNAKSILDNPKSCLELGTFEGRFSIWLAETYKCKVTTVDPFDGSVYGIADEVFKEAYRNCTTNFSKCKQEIELIHKPSYDALIELNHKKQRFDFIYIDGSHRSAEVLEDLVLAYRLLEKNGVLLLDDSVYWKARDHITNELNLDVTESPRLAVDSFIHIHWKDIEVLKLANNYQTAFRKLKH
jgi:predicted O-methyltransferase YrrM